jgi:menaquinone-9 beta-reductase
MARDVSSLVEEAELVIVGAGPAGSSCAARAAERGLDVVLIDQYEFPREKPCGGGITRAGVALLLQLGLDEVVERGVAIEGSRLVFDRRRAVEERYRPRHDRPGGGWGSCVMRGVLDKALLDVATERGVRFVKGCAQAQISGGGTEGVEVRVGAALGRIEGRVIVAADGAASRMRRQCGADAGARPMGYALRQYFETERELDPLFEVHLPLVLGERVLAGYGWIFPIDTHRANIGLGIVSGAGLATAPSPRHAFAAFLATLRENCLERFGDLRAVGDLLGAPVPLGFTPEQCAVGDMLFAGDAAHMVDPLSGEGIAYALRVGETVADIAYGRLRRGGVAPEPELGVCVARKFPRLVQDPTLLARMFVRRADRGAGSSDAVAGGGRRELEDMIVSLNRMVAGPDERETAVMSFLEQLSPRLAKLLDQWMDDLLDVLRTGLPLVSGLLQRRLRGRSGPTLATTLLLSSLASGGARLESMRRAALGSELVRLADLALSRIPIHDRTQSGHARACLGVLTCDLCLTRAIELTARIDLRVPQGICAANARLCAGQLLERRDLFRLDRTAEDYFETVGQRTAVLYEVAARLGAELAGAPPATLAALERYGRELGISLQIADDILALVNDDGVDGEGPGGALRAGVYTLPVIYALEDEPALRGMLRRAARTEDLASVVARVCETDGITRARGDCCAHVARAHEALAAMDGEPPAELHALARFACESTSALR